MTRLWPNYNIRGTNSYSPEQKFRKSHSVVFLKIWPCVKISAQLRRYIYIPERSTVNAGLMWPGAKWMSYLSLKILELVPNEIKESETLNILNSESKGGCPWRMFMQNVQIISWHMGFTFTLKTSFQRYYLYYHISIIYF